MGVARRRPSPSLLRVQHGRFLKGVLLSRFCQSFAFLGALLVALAALASLLLKCFPLCRVALQRHVQRNLSKNVASMDFTLARGPERFRPGNKPILV